MIEEYGYDKFTVGHLYACVDHHQTTLNVSNTEKEKKMKIKTLFKKVKVEGLIEIIFFSKLMIQEYGYDKFTVCHLYVCVDLHQTILNVSNTEKEKKDENENIDIVGKVESRGLNPEFSKIFSRVEKGKACLVKGERLR